MLKACINMQSNTASKPKLKIPIPMLHAKSIVVFDVTLVFQCFYTVIHKIKNMFSQTLPRFMKGKDQQINADKEWIHKFSPNTRKCQKLHEIFVQSPS